MGKKTKGATHLGKALIRDRFGSSRTKRNAGNSMLHSVDVNDGYDWGRLNLQSVTEESSFQEFLSTAELAGTEFHAEKLNIKFVNPKSSIGLLSKEEKKELLEQQEKHKSFLKIPRRPKWDKSTTPEELQNTEKDEFLEWRRQLTTLQEAQNLMLTPYEKNLEFWRQLWRVVERSDVIVQIVDARNPLLFRCEDLENYVKEINHKKLNVILINKADFLTEEQRHSWADYFSSIGVQVAFFSATLATKTDVIEEEEETDDSIHTEESDKPVEDLEFNEVENIEVTKADIQKCKQKKEQGVTSGNENYSDSDQGSLQQTACDQIRNVDNVATINEDNPLQEIKKSVEEIECYTEENKKQKTIENSKKLLSKDELIHFLKTIYQGKTFMEDVTTIGLVGYPNVGKSSTINALLGDKKVSVSATPGKTKHFQTLYLDKDLLLCDCPGLVMPSFVSTKAEMILNGILPIDQMRDHVPPVTLLGTLIPRHIIEDTYGIMLPLPPEGEDPDRPPTAEEILNAYGFNRGFMTQNGQPDNPRSSRYVLKDFVNGKLLYCVAPPSLKQEEFHVFPPRKRIISANKHLPDRTIRASKVSKITGADVDKTFFMNNSSAVHARGVIGKSHGLPQSSSLSGTTSIAGSTQSLLTEEKPWKKINKHCNKKKREKSRRLFAYLDIH